jgi:hypothetical protein
VLGAREAPGNWATNAIKANVRRTVRQLQSAAHTANSPPGSPEPHVVGAYYDFESGVVEFLDVAIEQ